MYVKKVVLLKYLEVTSNLLGTAAPRLSNNLKLLFAIRLGRNFTRIAIVPLLHDTLRSDWTTIAAFTCFQSFPAPPISILLKYCEIIN